jgi:hypothetical protein
MKKQSLGFSTKPGASEGSQLGMVAQRPLAELPAHASLGACVSVQWSHHCQCPGSLA